MKRLISSDTARPWETHISAALVLASLAFAVGEFWSPLAGSALVASALFVALRPLFGAKLAPVAG
jgi:hypothetical protein